MGITVASLTSDTCISCKLENIKFLCYGLKVLNLIGLTYWRNIAIILVETHYPYHVITSIYELLSSTNHTLSNVEAYNISIIGKGNAGIKLLLYPIDLM